MSESAIHFNGDNVTLVTAGKNNLATFTGVKLNSASNGKGSPSVNEPADDELNIGGKEWSPWGEYDDWPQKMLLKLDKLGVAKRGLDLSSDLHFGEGIVWKKQLEKDGETIFKNFIPKNWKTYDNESGISKAIADAINSVDTFGWAAVRVVLSGMDKVFRIRCLDTPNARVGYRHKKTGKIKKAYYSVNIHEKRRAKDEGVITLNVYDADDHENFIAKNKDFVFLVNTRSWGRFYYAEPNFFTTFRNGWADISISVPEMLKSIYANQATLKYHIKIPGSALLQKWKDFNTMTQEEQLTKMVEYRDEIQEVISNAEAAGTSVFTIYKDGADCISIEPIKDSLNTSKDLPNNVAANSEILFSIGIDPSLLGLNMPGGKDLNGSGGSQRKESLKIKQKTLTRERLETINLAYLVGKINGYGEDVHPEYLDIDINEPVVVKKDDIKNNTEK